MSEIVIEYRYKLPCKRIYGTGAIWNLIPQRLQKSGSDKTMKVYNFDYICTSKRQKVREFVKSPSLQSARLVQK